jgi:hypothetical protein
MAWLLGVIVSLAFIYTMDKKIGMEQIAQTEMARNQRAMERMEQMPPEQRQRALDTAVKFTRVISYVAPVLSIVFYLLAAAILMATFNFGFGARVPFKTSLAVTVYGFLPNVIGGLLGVVSLLAGVNPEGFNPRNPVASNVAYFMDPGSHKFLYGLASGLDVFSLWTVALLGLGFACVSRVKRSTAIVTVFGWFLLIKLVGAGWMAAFS